MQVRPNRSVVEAGSQARHNRAQRSSSTPKEKDSFSNPLSFCRPIGTAKVIGKSAKPAEMTAI
jgi:hypothetical protein